AYPEWLPLRSSNAFHVTPRDATRLAVGWSLVPTRAAATPNSSASTICGYGDFFVRIKPRHEIAGEAALRNVSLSNGEKISSNSETRNEGSAPPWDFFSRYLHRVRFVFLLSNKRLFNLP